MGRDDIPSRLREVAADIHKAIEEHAVWSPLREEVREWAADYCRDVFQPPNRIGGRQLEEQLLGRHGSHAMAAFDLVPLPGRELALREECALVAVVHDVCPEGARVDPWAHLSAHEKTREFFAYFRQQRLILDGELSPENENHLRLALANVVRVLTARSAEPPDNANGHRQRRSDSTPPPASAGWACAKDIAKEYDLPREALDQCLARFRRKDPRGNGWREVDSSSRSVREAKYFYSLPRIQKLIEDLKTRQINPNRRPASVECLAKKISQHKSP